MKKGFLSTVYYFQHLSPFFHPFYVVFHSILSILFKFIPIFIFLIISYLMSFTLFPSTYPVSAYIILFYPFKFSIKKSTVNFSVISFNYLFHVINFLSWIVKYNIQYIIKFFSISYLNTSVRLMNFFFIVYNDVHVSFLVYTIALLKWFYVVFIMHAFIFMTIHKQWHILIIYHCMLQILLLYDHYILVYICNNT